MIRCTAMKFVAYHTDAWSRRFMAASKVLGEETVQGGGTAGAQDGGGEK